MKTFKNLKVVSLVLTPDKFDYSSSSGISYSTIFQGLIIGSHPDVLRSVSEIRDRLGIKMSSYPKARDYKSVLLALWDSGHDKYKEISNEASLLVKKYRLTDNWDTPLQLMITTGVLQIPDENTKFVLHHAVDKSKVELRGTSYLSDLTDPEQHEARMYVGRADLPAIHITERIEKPQQLVDWIKNNWGMIKPELEKLPKRLKQRADIERLAIGLWFREMTQDKKMTWSQVDDAITELENKDPDFFLVDGKIKTPDVSKGPDFVYSAEETLQQFYRF